MRKSQAGTRRPPLHIVESEADTISNLAMSVKDRAPDVFLMLLEEIGRARLCKRSALPVDVVSMSSEVEYVDERSGTRRRVQLVYPNHADSALGRISILTPVGAGLIGLKAGHSILWPDREGRERRLTVVEVQQPARDRVHHG